MAMHVPTAFSSTTTPLPLSQLDANFDFITDGRGITFNVIDYGAVEDGTSDSTIAINAAIAAINALSSTVGATLYFPPGKYVTTSPSNLTAITKSNVVISGYGAVLYVNGPANGGLMVYNGGLAVSNVKIMGLRITSTTTGGIGIYLYGGASVITKDVTIENMATAIRFQSCNYCFCSNVLTSTCDYALYIYNSLGIFFNGGHLDGGGTGGLYRAGSHGIYFDGTNSGNFFENIDITTCEYGLKAAVGVGQSCVYNYFTNVLFDSSNYGVWMEATGGGVIQVAHFTACWVASSIAEGVHMKGVVGAIFTGAGNIFLNGSWGVSLDTCKNIQVSNSCLAYNNGQNHGAREGGIKVLDSSSIQVSHNLFTNDNTDWPGYTARQYVGVGLYGSSNDVQLIGNDFKGHTVADIDDQLGAVMTRSVIRSNTTSRSNVVASAAQISFELVFDIVHISGSTLIANIGNTVVPGKEVMFITDAACTIQNTFNWKLAGNFAGTAGSCLTVVGSAATGWTEKCRAIL